MDLFFKALNDETRRKILELLKKGDMTAGEIAESFNISKPSISHHLELLKRADLISSDKQGQFVIYSINTTVLEDVISWMLNLKSKNETSFIKRNSTRINPSRTHIIPR